MYGMRELAWANAGHERAKDTYRAAFGRHLASNATWFSSATPRKSHLSKAGERLKAMRNRGN